MKFRIVLSGVFALTFAGCVSSGTKVTADQQAAFKEGTTTEAEVVAKLGPPNSVSTLTDGTKVEVYMHVAAHATAATYVPIVGLFAGGAKETSDSVIFTYDAQGVLKTMASNRTQTNVKTGLANQQ